MTDGGDPDAPDEGPDPGEGSAEEGDDISIPGLGEPREEGDRGAVDLPGSDGDGVPGATAGGAPGGIGSDGDDPATDADGDAPGTEADADDGGEEDEVEPVEVLVQLAREGEIDPWDIDIVTVTDEFLARLDEADLRGSGRALFYASVLLRMKGDDLLTEDDEEDEAPEPEPWEAGFGDPGTAGGEPPDDFDPIAGLEGELERRLDRKRARGTPETLDELVRELREAEREARWKDSREYDTSDSPQGYRRGTQTLDYRADDDVRMDDEPTEADVTDTAHAEDVESLVAEVQSELRRHYDAGREEVLFAEVRDAGGSTVQTYLGLLFLSHRGHVTLQQDDLFGDLWIRDPAAGAGESKGVAD